MRLVSRLRLIANAIADCMHVYVTQHFSTLANSIASVHLQCSTRAAHCRSFDVIIALVIIRYQDTNHLEYAYHRMRQNETNSTVPKSYS